MNPVFIYCRVSPIQYDMTRCWFAEDTCFFFILFSTLFFFHLCHNRRTTWRRTWLNFLPLLSFLTFTRGLCCLDKFYLLSKNFNLSQTVDLKNFDDIVQSALGILIFTDMNHNRFWFHILAQDATFSSRTWWCNQCWWFFGGIGCFRNRTGPTKTRTRTATVTRIAATFVCHGGCGFTVSCHFLWIMDRI